MQTAILILQIIILFTMALLIFRLSIAQTEKPSEKAKGSGVPFCPFHTQMCTYYKDNPVKCDWKPNESPIEFPENCPMGE